MSRNYDTMNVPSRRDIASEYVQSIVDGVSDSTRAQGEEEEFPVYQSNSERRLYGEQQDSAATERPGGELVIDEKPDLNSVSYPLRSIYNF